MNTCDSGGTTYLKTSSSISDGPDAFNTEALRAWNKTGDCKVGSPVTQEKDRLKKIISIIFLV